jgi:hypothetical protein
MTPPSRSAAPPGLPEDTDTEDLSPYSLRMRLTTNLPEEARPSTEGFVGETERNCIDAMEWVGLPEVSGGNEEPVKGASRFD